MFLSTLKSLLHGSYIYLDRHVKILCHIVEKLSASGVSPHGLHGFLGTAAHIAESETLQSSL